MKVKLVLVTPPESDYSDSYNTTITNAYAEGASDWEEIDDRDLLDLQQGVLLYNRNQHNTKQKMVLLQEAQVSIKVLIKDWLIKQQADEKARQERYEKYAQEKMNKKFQAEAKKLAKLKEQAKKAGLVVS